MRELPNIHFHQACDDKEVQMLACCDANIPEGLDIDDPT
jgi:hypothetical protein